MARLLVVYYDRFLWHSQCFIVLFSGIETLKLF